jgi:hypothetical protein
MISNSKAYFATSVFKVENAAISKVARDVLASLRWPWSLFAQLLKHDNGGSKGVTAVLVNRKFNLTCFARGLPPHTCIGSKTVAGAHLLSRLGV